MSWLSASEAFVMESAVRDRVDDLRATSDAARAATPPAGGPRSTPPLADAEAPRDRAGEPPLWRRARAACLL
jgi:hypothetical protein